MLSLIILGAIVLVPVLLALLFRVHALFVFLSICAGYFLQFALSDDVDLAFATIVRGSDTIVFARLVLLLLPILLTIFVLRRSQAKSALLQILPLVFSGLFLAVITMPLLPENLHQIISESEYGGNIKGAEDLIITAAVVSNLVLSWMLFKTKGGKHSKHH